MEELKKNVTFWMSLAGPIVAWLLTVATMKNDVENLKNDVEKISEKQEVIMIEVASLKTEIKYIGKEK